MSFLCLLIGAAHADSWSTDDIDYHLSSGDVYSDTAEVDAVVASATLTIKYGLWDSPDVVFDVYVNDELVGSVTADAGYISPGPDYETWDVADLLVVGDNTIDVEATSGGEAVLGRLDLEWEPGGEDADGDGYGEYTDCDEADAGIHPGAEDVAYDGIDQDCDGEDLTDVDGDGWDADTVGGEDCDDTDSGIHPDAEEVCDGLDSDCDGEVDDDSADGVTWWLDADGDGYGTTDDTIVTCSPPEGYADNSRDCGGDDATRYPGATETCDDVDDDCDGTVDDDAIDATSWYPDADGDGYGDDAQAVTACDAPDGYIATGGDCDDTLTWMYPGAVEYCDGNDEDCDGEVDDDAVNQTPWYLDADGDGYGDPDTATSDCDAPDGYVADGTDCDDSDAALYPGAPGYDEACVALPEEEEPPAEDDDEKGEPTGCGCATPGGGAGLWGALVAAAVLGRRKMAR